MPVRIVDPTPDPKVEKFVSCRQCGARLAYVPLDVLTRNGKDYSGGADGEDYVMCPCCNRKVILRSW